MKWLDYNHNTMWYFTIAFAVETTGSKQENYRPVNFDKILSDGIAYMACRMGIGHAFGFKFDQ